MGSTWDIQKCIYNQLINDSTVSNLVNNKIYDEPPTNAEYPYITIGDEVCIDDNDLSHNGYIVNITIDIHTTTTTITNTYLPYSTLAENQIVGSGYFIGKYIYKYVNDVLHYKKFTLDSDEMVICKLEQMFTTKIKDKRLITARYEILVDTNTQVTF